MSGKSSVIFALKTANIVILCTASILQYNLYIEGFNLYNKMFSSSVYQFGYLQIYIYLAFSLYVAATF